MSNEGDVDSIDPSVSTRRYLEQIRHCIVEAESVLAADEHPTKALEDLVQARFLLINAVIPRVKQAITGR